MGEYKLSDNIIKLRELVKELDKDDEMSPKGLKIEKEFPLDVIKSTCSDKFTQPFLLY